MGTVDMEKWTLTWTKLTALDKDYINSMPGNIPGVYRLSYKSEDDNYYVFYVGQSEDIKNRLLEHMSSSEINVCIKNYLATKSCFFRYAKITKEYIRNAAEKQMFNHYEPSCNDKEPDGRDDVKVNLT